MLTPLNDEELEMVSGGDIVVSGGDDDYWAEELLRYKMGQPSRFGNGG